MAQSQNTKKSQKGQTPQKPRQTKTQSDTISRYFFENGCKIAHKEQCEEIGNQLGLKASAVHDSMKYLKSKQPGGRRHKPPRDLFRHWSVDTSISQGKRSKRISKPWDLTNKVSESSTAVGPPDNTSTQPHQLASETIQVHNTMTVTQDLEMEDGSMAVSSLEDAYIDYDDQEQVSQIVDCWVDYTQASDSWHDATGYE
ncbi:hypothetical protein BDV93DRAFT_584608 [Ceratobasidium sp. AG-I]|nr:hypothetical protein BDV93DRAFT_584608 [Ceratobasidium sp. AG-I]